MYHIKIVSQAQYRQSDRQADRLVDIHRSNIDTWQALSVAGRHSNIVIASIISTSLSINDVGWREMRRVG